MVRKNDINIVSSMGFGNKMHPEMVEISTIENTSVCPMARTIRSILRKKNIRNIPVVYSKEKADGKIIYKVIDISKKENEAIADKYEVTWSSLFVNGWKDGKENVNNMTEFSFSNAKNTPDKFKEGIKSKIDELLKQL